MGYKILGKKELIPGQTTMMVIDAPQVAKKAKPGNFVMLRTTETGERIPLTIADCDKEKGTITIVYLVVGKTTAEMNTLPEGGEFMDVCGPLGRPTHIEKSGTVVCVGGGTGIAAMHHIAKGHVEAGNRVIAIVARGPRTCFCSAPNFLRSARNCASPRTTAARATRDSSPRCSRTSWRPRTRSRKWSPSAPCP